MMNWAILAREDRLYKGKTLYRWDVSPGLEHHCGTCATPLHNARSKSSCLGKHVEPCFRFHQQLHFLGKSHECLGCNTSDEMHHTRHKEILTIIREINSYDQTNLSLDSQFIKRKEGPDKKLVESETTSETTGIISEMSFEEESLTRRERKKAKKLGTRTRRNVEVYSQDDLNSISEILHGKVHESKGAWEGTYAYDNRRTESSLTSSDMVEEDEDFDTYAVQSPTPASNKEYKAPNYPTPKQQRAARRLTTITPIRQSKLRGHQQKFTPETVHKNDPYGGINPDIFYCLGIDVNPPSNPKARKDLTGKLIIAIQNDLQVIRREEEEAIIREEGFWRWAGRNAFRNILEYRKTFDWATGQKITTTKTEAEIFGDELDDGQINELEKDDIYGTAEDKGELVVDKLVLAKMMTEMDIVQEKADETEENIIGKKERRVKKGIRVLKITTAYESKLKHKPKPTKSISKVSLGKKKKGWKCFESEGLIDNSVEQDGGMAEEGLHDLIRAYKDSGVTSSNPSSWAAVVGYASDGTTSTIKKSKKSNMNSTIMTHIEEDEWITVVKKGKKN
ncbi:hypothetical protein EYC80_001684 [Monilinia laxa]|uniref:Uncharacterized protein n=1 Tax=Monilinia laxa TaxID=61186 RepID=A0A5N6K5N2_MONLA|nr:hypothetical protein EYC80_001684 [Monilinia laxa]